MKLRDHLCAGLLALGALAPVEAFASTSHFVELQLDANSVASVVQKRLKTDQSHCPFIVPCAQSPNGCYVDHYDVPQLGTLSRGNTNVSQPINAMTTLSSPRIEFTQGIAVHLKTVECADTAGCTTTTPISATLGGHLTLQGDDLCVAVDSFVGAPSSIPTPSINACVGLSGNTLLDSLELSNATVSGHAFSLSGSGDRLALRTEIGIPMAMYSSSSFLFDANRVAAWQAFIDGSLAPATGVGAWRGFLHRELLEEKFEQVIDDFVASDSSMLSATPAQMSWLPLGAAGAAATVTSELVTQQGPCEIDVDVTIPLTIAKNSASDGLHLLGQIEYDASGWDTFVCGAKSGDLLFALGALIAGEFVEVDLANETGLCTTQSNGDLECNIETHPQTMNFGFGQMAIATLTDVIGVSNGLFMSGPLMLTGPATPTVNIGVQSPKLGLRGNCHSATCSIQGGVYVTGTAKLCEIGLTGDTSNLFDVTLPSDLTLPAAIEIKLKPGVTDQQIAAFNQAPYALYAKVVTTAGANTYALQPQLLSSQEQDFWCGGYQVLKLIRCLQTKPPVWENPYDRWKNDWALDPHFEIPVQLFDYGSNPFDEAIVHGIDIEVTWVRGLVDTARIVGVLSSTFKTSALMQQEFSLNVPGVRGMRVATAAELVDAVLLNGFTATVDIDAALLPRGVGAYGEFVVPGEMLMEAASH